MKILHVVPTYWPAVRYGGTITSTRGLVRALVGRGHAVSVATTSVDGPGDARALEGGARDVDGAAVHYFPSGTPRRLYRSRAMAAFLAAHAADFDVVHAHAAFLWPTWAARGAAVAARRPFVHSPRGMLADRLIRTHNAGLKRLWIATIERANLACAAAVHFTSRAEAEAYEALRLPARPPRLAVIPNGCDAPTALPATPRESGLVLYLGRLSREKRVERLLEAMPALSGARLIVAGESANGRERQRLEDVARRLGLGSRVEFRGFVDDAQKAILLARASVLVLPSVFESFGNVVVEAMARACPVLVSRGVGAAELVEQAGAGRVVSDEETLAGALEGMLSSPDATFGDRGRAYAQSELRWDRVAEHMERLYAEVVAGRR